MVPPLVTSFLAQPNHIPSEVLCPLMCAPMLPHARSPPHKQARQRWSCAGPAALAALRQAPVPASHAAGGRGTSQLSCARRARGTAVLRGVPGQGRPSDLFLPGSEQMVFSLTGTTCWGQVMLILPLLQVSTASSGSPEQQQQQQAAASPLRTFALPGDEEALQQGPAACTPTPRQHLDNIEQETPVQQQQHGSTGVPGGDRPAAGERSASSIGRKRANSEAGCSEGPASVKKRSPDVGSRGQLGPCSHAEQLAAGPAAAPVAAACTGVAACAASTKGQAEQEREQQEKLQGQQQQPAGLPEPAGAARPAQAAAPAAEGTRTASRRGPDSPTAGPGRLIIPVVLQHSPPQKRRQQQQHAAAHARAAGAADGEAQPTRQQAPPATKAAAAEIAGTLAAKPGQLDQREQQQQQEQEQGASAKPAAKTRAAAAGADVAGASMPSQQPAVAAVRVAPPPVSVPLADTVSPRQELPSLSEWVDACSDGLQQPKGRHQRPPGSEELEMPSTSVLIGGGRALQPMHSNNPAQHDRQQQQQQAAPPLAPAPPSATPGSGSAVPVAATAPPIGGAVADAPVITPRRRTTTLEPPETVLCLQEDAQGGCCHCHQLAALPCQTVPPSLHPKQVYGRRCLVAVWRTR